MGIYEREAYSVDVGTRLRQLREERNMSMRSLATASGLSANALSMIERGKTSPSVSTLYKLADAMGVPITTFFGEQTTKQQVIFMRAQERPRVSFSRGCGKALAASSFRAGLNLSC
jgi:transcriptional regulator with XRE-family HTH domain